MKFAIRIAKVALFVFLPFTALKGGDALPDSYDLRNIDGHSYIGAVHDQGGIGSCYAFSACAVAEAAYNRANGLYDDACADFSESFIVWSMDSYYGGLYGADGSACYYDELQSLVDFGVCSESDFPYTETAPADGNYHMDAARVTFNSWHYLPSYDVETMKRAMLLAGALNVGVEVDAESVFYTSDYKGEVFSNDSVGTTSILEADSTMNHAVALVGWDDATESWILRNSWSDEWGDDGYGSITYYTMRVTTCAAYLLYDEWTGEDFSDVNDGAVVAGNFSEDGTTHAYAYYRWGGNDASLTNSGSFAASVAAPTGENAFTYGAFLWAGENAAMTNSGSIFSSAQSSGSYLATAYGMCLQGYSMENSGSVVVTSRNDDGGRASAYGVSFFGYDRDSSFFDNSGSINAMAIGSDSWATGAHLALVESAVNTGDIIAVAETEAGGIAAIQCGTVENSGTIHAKAGNGDSWGVYIEQSGSFVNDEGALVEAFAVNGTATGIYADTCDVVNDGTILGDISTISTAKISGKGVFDCDLTCSDAVLSPGTGVGDVETLTVFGDFKSTGTFTMNLDVKASGSDVLAVGGSATIEEDATLRILTKGYVASGDYLFISSDGASGTFSTVTTPLMYRGSVDTGDDGFTLELLRRSYSEFSTSLETIPMAVGMDSARPLATGKLAAVLENLDDSTTEEPIRQAVADLFPSMNSLASFAALSGMRRTGAMIRERFADSLDGGDRNTGGWLQGITSNSDRDAYGVYPTCSDEIHGIMAGYDMKLGGRWTLGAGVTSTTQSVDADESGSASIRARSGSVYALWDARRDERGVWVSSSISAGTARIDSRRSVDFLSDAVNSRHGADSLGISTGAGWDFGWKMFYLRPFAGVDYAFLHEKAYTEKDDDGVALSFRKNDIGALSADSGLSLFARLSWNEFQFVPEVRVLRTFELLDNEDDATASFSVGDTFEIPGCDGIDDGWTGEASIRVIYENRVGFGASYAKTSRDDGSSEIAAIWVRMTF
jgi:uncharacterized protein with beta-barrel porin domain